MLLSFERWAPGVRMGDSDRLKSVLASEALHLPRPSLGTGPNRCHFISSP